MNKKYTFITVSLLNDLESVCTSIFKFNKLYKINKYVIIVPKKDIKDFENKLNCFKNIEIIEEDRVCSKKKFYNLCDSYFKNNQDYESFRKNWYYQQILKLNYISDTENFSNNNIVIWDADTIPIRKIEFFDDENIPFIYGSGYEYYSPYFVTNKLLLGSKSAVLNLSCITQFVALNLQIRKDIKKFFLDYNSKIKIKNSDLFIANVLLNVLSSSPKLKASSPNIDFSEYEFIGNFILNNYKRSKKEQKRIKFFRNNVDGKLNLIQEKILCFLNYKHITYENKYCNGKVQTYKNLFKCIFKDFLIYKYISKTKNRILKKIKIVFKLN